MYRHLFFDLDHTLWDFDANSRQVMHILHDRFRLAERGITDFDTFYQVYHDHNERLWVRFRKGFIRRDELRWKRMWHTLLDFKIGDTRIANELSVAYLELLPAQKALTPYAKELLEYCSSRDYKLHIITNGFETTQRQKLHYCGLSPFFEQLITSEKSGSIKPRREIFDFALQAADARREESIMIGDALDIDIAGAMNAGWDQVYYNPAGQRHESSPTHEIRSLEELLHIL